MADTDGPRHHRRAGRSERRHGRRDLDDRRAVQLARRLRHEPRLAHVFGHVAGHDDEPQRDPDRPRGLHDVPLPRYLDRRLGEPHHRADAGRRSRSRRRSRRWSTRRRRTSVRGRSVPARTSHRPATARSCSRRSSAASSAARRCHRAGRAHPGTPEGRRPWRTGLVTVDGSLLATDSFFGPGRALEFSAAIDGEAFQHAGLGTDLNDLPWALISSFSGNAGLFARTNNGTATNTPITASTGQMHRYRIEWTASGLVYYADGALVATHPTPIGANMRPVVSDIFVNTSTVRVDWLRLSPYASTGTFTSRVLGDGSERAWGDLTADVVTPAGTSVALSVRTGDTPTPDGTWTDWQSLPRHGRERRRHVGVPAVPRRARDDRRQRNAGAARRRGRVPAHRAAASDRPLLG